MSESNYKYSGLIYCYCGHKFRGFTENNKNKYICQNYAKNSKNSLCDRLTIFESEIDFIYSRHFPQSEIMRIVVDRNKIEIIYTDQTKSIISSNEIIF